MDKQRSIVLVVASFLKGADLFNWFKRYAQHADDRFAYWDELAFTTSVLPEYDAILVLNAPQEKINVISDPGKTIALMMEPGIKTEHPWMFKHLEQYSKVYSPVASGSNVQLSHGYLGWYFDRDLSSLVNLSLPQKIKTVSCIVSNLKQLQGHRLRLKFVNQLQKEIPGLDMFGKGINYISDKIEGLIPYRYSIAIENSSIPDYFTEKINDCFLAYTVPIYYGCKNIDHYFPSKSFITIDINDTVASIKKIKDVIDNDDWSARLEAVKEARELVLHQYQPLAGSAAILKKIPVSSKQTIELSPVQQTLTERINTVISRIKQKMLS